MVKDELLRSQDDFLSKRRGEFDKYVSRECRHVKTHITGFVSNKKNRRRAPYPYACPKPKTPAMKMVKTTLTSTITIRYQSPSRSSLLLPWAQSLRCLHTTTTRRRTAHQSITTRQPAQASPMLLAKQQYLKTRIKDLGILPGMYPP